MIKILSLNQYRKERGNYMKKTVELLKNEGIIGKLQRSLNELKPPEGLADATINKVIIKLVRFEMSRCQNLTNQIFDTFFEDMAEAVRNELNIEYLKPGDDGIMGAIATVMKMITDELEKEGE